MSLEDKLNQAKGALEGAVEGLKNSFKKEED